MRCSILKFWRLPLIQKKSTAYAKYTVFIRASRLIHAESLSICEDTRLQIDFLPVFRLSRLRKDTIHLFTTSLFHKSGINIKHKYQSKQNWLE